MSRYSSNFAEALSDGASTRSWTPARTPPSSLKPPTSISAEASIAGASTHNAPHMSPTTVRASLIRGPLADEPGAGRMVGPVDSGVTVRARPPKDEFLRRTEDEFVASPIWGGGVDPLLVVALLAQPRLGDLQHLLVVGPVWIMAVRAALQDGRVLPEEGPALLRMAAVACIVERVLLQERGRDGAVRVVARRARHLALAERHVRIAQLLRALAEVAGPARVHHSRLGELVAGRDVLHDRVTARARDVARLVAAALPEEAGALRVAREALRIALIDRGGVLLGEGDQPADDLPARIPVGFAGPVAALAAHALPRRARVLEEETSHVSLRE